MYFKPLIAICYDCEIIDLAPYRKWGAGGLLLESFRIYEHFKDCKTAGAFRTKRTAELRRSFPETDPEYYWTKPLEEYIEKTKFQIIIDFTNQCIYCRKYALSAERIRNLPDSRDMLDTLTRRQRGDFNARLLMDFMESCVFRMDQLDIRKILRLSRDAMGFYAYY